MVGGVVLRDVMDSDLRVFYEQQLDPEATRMAAFPSRGRDAFMAHWAKIMADETTALQTVIFRGGVAGNVVSWEQGGERNVGYWFGREYWGQGVANAALSQFLQRVTTRPLHAHVAKHNLASIRVLQKCGFTVSGEARFSDADGEQGEEFILTLGPAV
jgi:RimJ/RimL family protein N-acetyltransferase